MMATKTISIIFVLISLIFIVKFCDFLPLNQDKRLFGPDRNWTRIKERINSEAASYGFDNLEKREASSDDLEIRIWASGGLASKKAVIIKKSQNIWSAYSLLEADGSENLTNLTNLVIPDSDWDELWSKLVSEHILTLPDQLEVEKPVRYEDGQSIVIERLNMGKYKIYVYTEPNSSEPCEGQHLVYILNTIRQEFDINLYAYPEDYLISGKCTS